MNLTTFSQANLPAVSTLSSALRSIQAEVGPAGVVILKMDKTGHWVFGADQTEVEDDAVWAVNPFSFVHGFIAWGDGEVTTRRSFMQMIGLAPVAAAANSLPSGIVGGSPPEAPYGLVNNAIASTENPAAKAVAKAWFSANGVPSEIVERIKVEASRSSRYAENLDADLQSAKSFSLATKRRMQTERNIEREIQNTFGRWDFEIFHDAFKNKFGTNLPFHLW